MRVGLLLAVALCAVAVLAGVPGDLRAAVGDRLALITPATPGVTGNGRGMEIAAGTRTAWYSTQGSEQSIFTTDVLTNEYAGTKTTTLTPGVYGYGALAWDATDSVMWASEYSGSYGWIDRIDPASGTTTRVFNARAVFGMQLDGVDGLTVDTDGTLWISGDGINWPDGTRVVHAGRTGTDLGGEFTAPFGNSGIIADGPGLWLVDHHNARVHLYSRAGASLGVSFPATGLSQPEDGTLDTCSFAGRKALWLYESAIGASGKMAAYDVGESANTGCPARPTPTTPTTPTTPGTGGSGSLPTRPEIRATDGAGGTAYVAGRPLVLIATSARDPGGTRYVYLWDFGDGTRVLRGRGRVTRRAPSPGFYHVRVRVVTKRGKAVRTVSSSLVVEFSRGKIITERGRQVLPYVVNLGSSVRVTMSTQSVAIGAPSITRSRFTWDALAPRIARRPLASVTFPKGAGRRHLLRWTATFSNGRVRQQASCLIV